MGKKRVTASEAQPKTKTRFVTQEQDALQLKRYESLATLSALVNAFCLAYLPDKIVWDATLINDPITALAVASCGTLCVQFYLGMHTRVWWAKDESLALEADEDAVKLAREEAKKDPFARKAGQSIEVRPCSTRG